MLSTTTDKTALGLEILKRHDISISRHSKDKCKNSHGTLFLDVLKNRSLFILNGRVGRDALIGKVTCEGISLVDYAISSPEIFPIVKDFCVHDFNPIFSDVHCAISLELEVENRKENEKYQADQISVMNCSIETTNMPNIRHDWSSDSINRFKNNLRILESKVSEICDKIDNANISSLDYEASKILINSIVKELNDISIESASRTFPSNTIMNNQVRKPRTAPIGLKDKPWFNKECRPKKNQYYRVKNLYEKNKTQTGIAKFTEAKKQYKKTVNCARKTFNKKMNSKLRTLKDKDPKKFWSIINDKRTEPIKEIQIETLCEYF